MPRTSVKNLIVRVYGILINEQNEVLLSDEYWYNTFMTKFPGGALELGEGPIDCLKREWKEELGLEIEIISHLYTTDFFYKSAFHKETQIICIYYLVKANNLHKCKVSNQKYDFPELVEGAQSCRWVSLSSLTENDLTFPSDKKVITFIRKTKIPRSEGGFLF